MPIPETPIQRDNTATNFHWTKDGNQYLQGELYLAAKRRMEQEQKEREEAERKARQERFANMSDAERQSWVQEQWDKTEGLGEADSATDWYHAIEEDPYKEAEWDRNAAITSSIGSTIAGLPFSIGSIGLIPTITTTAGGYGLSYGGQKLGEAIDAKYNTNWTPWLSTIGGFLGGWGGYKGTVNLGSKGLLPKGGQIMYGKQFVTDVAPNALNRNIRQITPTRNYISNELITPDSHRATFTPTQSSGGRYTFYERPSKLTLAERMGIPKGERNNVVRIQNPIVNDVLNNHKYGTINPDELIETVATKSLLGSYSNDPIKKFVSTLDIDTHPAFTSINKDGKLFEHPTVTEFRNYLNNNGVDASVYSTDELSKLLTYEFLDKTKTATGALKDMILWHTTNGNFDAFDFMTHLGKNTRNRGLYGMGNYFSTEFPQQYGINAQPFIISGINDLKHYSQIKSWRNMPIFKDKTVPKGLAVLGSNSGPYVKTTFRPYMNHEGITPYEIVVPKNHGIKSLFPHPSRFIQQPDGSVILKSTDWADIRFNFKNGGKL